MEARELRIGNLVLFDSNWEYRQEDNWQEHLEPYPIDCLMSDNTVRLNDNGKSIGCFFILQVNPIQLTEEWLVRLGFEFNDVSVDDFDDDFNEIINPDDFQVYSTYKKELVNKKYWYKINLNPDDICEFTIESTWNDEMVLSRINYVHQLQNLYFALTGTELETTSNIHERG